ncbi:MAG: glycosyltransferase family 39 protein, partial [Anaerolineae bacterium]
MGTLALFAVALTQGARVGLNAAQWLRFGAAFALLWVLPALAWARRLDGDPAERAASGMGLAFVGSGLATLVLHLLPGAFPTGSASLVYLALVLIPLAVPRRHTALPQPSLRRRHAAMAGVLLAAVMLRVVHLGYSEFQGDEAVIMQRAAEALAGDDGELFLHQKGPAEILVPMSLWALTGTMTEAQMRLPFALAGALAVLVVMCLGDRWFEGSGAGSSALGPGVIAGLLVGISGFLVAFSRILQYQNLVVAMGGLALLWLTRYRERARWDAPVPAVAFMAYGLLAHYDAVLVAPPALVLVVQAILATSRDPARGLKAHSVYLLVAALVGAAILSLFYLPFVANPMFSRTFSYLAGGRLGGSLFHNSLLSNWRMSTFYNALAYVLGLIALVGAAAVMRLGDLTSWLFLLVPFLFYNFIVADPRTHVYTFYPGAALLAGAALAHSLRALAKRWKPVLVVTACCWYLLCAGYVVIVFVDHKVEYKRVWPQSRHPLYPVPFADDELPPYGHFGFPYRAGWKAVEALFAQGLLDGTYASNEEPEITTWYVRSGLRTMCGAPDLYVVAETVQDEIAIDWAELERDYGLVARVEVDGRTKIRVY